MKSEELYKYLFWLKVRGEKTPLLKELAKENNVSSVAIMKNYKQLIKQWLAEKTSYWKYEIIIKPELEKIFHIRRIEFLEDEVKNWKNLYEWADSCAMDLSKSYNELRKSLDFEQTQNKRMDLLIKEQTDLISKLRTELSDIYKEDNEDWKKRNWLKRLFYKLSK